MATHRWRDSPEIIARMIDSGSIQSWSAKNIVLKPNETCVIMSDGKIQDILSETVLKNYVGGFTRWLGSKMGMGSRDHKMIFAMTGPFDLLFKMEGATADGAKINGMLNMRLQIQRDDVPKLLNIFANSGRELNRGFFVKMYESEIISRVVIPLLSKQADINAVRSPDFADMIEMAVRAEMRGSFDQYGITMLRAFAVVNETDLEKLQAFRQQNQVLADRADLINENSLAAIDRQQSLTLARIEAEANVAKAKARGQVEAALETELLELRKQEAEWAAERQDQAERQDIQLDGKQRKMDIAMGAFEQVQAAKRELDTTLRSAQDQAAAALFCNSERIEDVAARLKLASQSVSYLAEALRALGGGGEEGDACLDPLTSASRADVADVTLIESGEGPSLGTADAG